MGKDKKIKGGYSKDETYRRKKRVRAKQTESEIGC